MPSLCRTTTRRALLLASLLAGGLLGCVPPGDEGEPAPLAGELSVSSEDPDNRYVLDFGAVAVGGEAELGIHLHNIGDGELTVTDLIFEDSPGSFELTVLTDITPAMAPDTWWTLWVVFVPQAEGEALNEIAIVSTDREEPVTVTLLGQGIAATD